MKQLRLTIRNDVGLHARPAAQFVEEAGKYQSSIQMRNSTVGSNWVNACSMLAVLALGVEQNHEIELHVEGPDEELAIGALKSLIESNLSV